MSALILLMIFHAFGAKWVVVVRRVLEAMASSVLLFAVLFMPILLGLKYLYSWVDPPATLPRDVLKLLEHKKPYLNQTFFLVRTVFYFLMFALVAVRLFRLSTKQDEVGGTDLTRRQRVFGTGMLPLMSMVFTFAAFDWVMSLNPLWYSTIFGVYFFAGSFVSVFAVLAIAAQRARGANEFGAYVSIEHVHNIGKLMLSFVAFWAYVAFSQFMLIWIANLPEEIQFFLPRLKGEWAVVGWVADPRPLLDSVRRAAVAVAQAQPRQARGRGGLDPLHPLRRRVLAGDADAVARDPRVSLDHRHGVPGRRAAVDLVHGLAAARSLLDPGQGSLPGRIVGV